MDKLASSDPSTANAQSGGECARSRALDSPMQKVNIVERLEGFSERWSPRIVGECNGQHVKLVKLLGEFIWHHHEREDELFLVVKGSLTIRFRDSEVRLEPGEFIVVPKGVEHLPVATEKVQVLLFEPVGTLNTGNVRNERTVEHPQRA